MPVPPEMRWLWNGDLRPDTLRHQLAAIRDLGYRGVAVWPWSGLAVPFLSPDYLACLGAVCESAAGIGVELWLADDLHWPSGTAGGALLEARPDLAQRALVCSSRWVLRRESREVRWRGEGEALVTALALDAGGGRRDLSRVLQQNSRLVREPRVARCGGHEAGWEADVWDAPFRLPPGDWFVTIATVVRCRPLLPSAIGTRWSAGALGTLDVLDPDTVQASADYVLDRYAAALGRFLGTTVRGIVTTPSSTLQPHPIEPPAGWRIDVLPWFPDLPARFEAREGQPLANRLPYLLAPLHRGEGDPADRFAPIARLADERYAESYWPVFSRRCLAYRLQPIALTPAEREALPAMPYTLAAARRWSVPPELVVAVEAGARSARSPASPPALPPGLAAALARPGAGGTRHPRLTGGRKPAAGLPPERPGWQRIEVLQTTWQWRPHSLNLHPLAPWSPPPPDIEHAPYRAAFEADYLPPDLALAFEAGVVAAIRVNESPLPLSEAVVPSPEQVQFADIALRLLPLRGVAPLVVGLNQIEAALVLPVPERALFHFGATLAPLFVVGSFALRPSAAGGCLVRPVGELPLGDWAEAGYPRYCGSATYRQTCVVPSLPPGARLQLLVDAFDGVVAIEANQRPLAGPLNSPCTVDATEHLPAGLTALAITVTNRLEARLAGGVPSGLATARLEWQA